MHMDWELSIEEVAGSGGRAPVLDLLRFARHEPALAGRIVAQEEPLRAGAMGTLAGCLKIMGVPARSLASLVVAWLNTYNSDVTVKLSGADGRCLEVSANRVKRMRAEELPPLVGALATLLEGGVPPVASGAVRVLPEAGQAAAIEATGIGAAGIEARAADDSATPAQ